MSNFQLKLQVKKIKRDMAEHMSGVTVVIFIAFGVLTFIMLFIFAKRQIMRFALRSRRGPHAPIGHEAKKNLKRELERMIDAIPRIVYEPQLMFEDDTRYILQPGTQLPPHYFRMKAVDDVKMLEQEISKQDSCLVRHPSENLRSYLLTMLAVPLNGLGQKLVHQFCDLYEHARHDPSEFGDEEYQMYSKLLLKLLDASRLIKSYPNSRKSSPVRTPLKRSQDKYRTVLESKLKSSDKRYGEEEMTPAGEKERPISLLVPASTENSETSV